MAGFKAQPKVLQTHCCVLMLTEATHQVWRGQEPLWRDVSWDMSSGKCQGGVNSISKINGECWKWHLLVSDQIGGRKRNKQKRHRSPLPPALLSLEKVSIDPAPPAHALKLVSVSPSHLTWLLFKLLPSCWFPTAPRLSQT